MAARPADGSVIDVVENKRRMRDGELYYAFTPDLLAERKRCALAIERLNNAGVVPRRRLVALVRE
jgi:hypothetical protein